MPGIVYHEYLTEFSLFTVIALPEAAGKYPTVIFRNPYVDNEAELTEEEICQQKLIDWTPWLENGYAVVSQHCRGRGKSGGDCIPYINEREDGLFLQDWVRQQPFYNGEIYLCGGSYTSTVHMVTAPFAPDIKGAVLEVKDCNRYNCNYRNGFYKMGLHGGWYVKMYKHNSIPFKPFVPECYHMLPLSDFSKAILGESAPDFDEILRHPKRDDPFWMTRYGGGEEQDALKHARIPILLTTGFYDVFAGGVFDMWHGMDDETRALSALAVHPYCHSGLPDNEPLPFDKACLKNVLPEYRIHWLNYIRGKENAPFIPGKITYYHLFSNQWRCDDFASTEKEMVSPLGEGEKTYRYNPFAPATFKGGLSANFGGNEWQDDTPRYDILTFDTPVFTESTSVKGKMKAKLRVKSNCEDTCFYIRISLVKEEGLYGLRDDIQQISNFDEAYVPGTEIDIDFSFDEHAFVIQPGEKLHIAVSSSAFPFYVPHTNQRGLFSEQTTAKIADNTVICSHSWLSIPVE